MCCRPSIHVTEPSSVRPCRDWALGALRFRSLLRLFCSSLRLSAEPCLCPVHEFILRIAGIECARTIRRSRDGDSISGMSRPARPLSPLCFTANTSPISRYVMASTSPIPAVCHGQHVPHPRCVSRPTRPGSSPSYPPTRRTGEVACGGVQGPGARPALPAGETRIDSDQLGLTRMFVIETGIDSDGSSPAR